MPRPQGVTPPEEKWKLLHLFNRIQSYKDESREGNQRLLSESLQKVPTQKENPEYHKVVSRPVDFNGIITKMQKEQYHSVEEMIEDLLLLFNNTIKAYKPYTQIYKDALTLHCVLLQAQSELMDLDNNRVEVPDVQQCVQELLRTIYSNILNFQDESGKYLMTVLVNFLERECSQEILLIDFSTVSNKLYTGCYQRLDQMQKDLFAIFERIRQLAKDNQEIYYSAVRLQEYYILTREQVCEWGQVLDSPALRYINVHLQSDLKVEKAREKVERAGGSPDSTSDMDTDYSNMTVPLVNMRTNETCVREDGSPQYEQYVTETGCYKIGDCLYLHPEGRNKPGIAKIDMLWEDKDGVPWFQGPIFLYPEDTKHLPTTVFYEKEVFQGQQVVHQMSDVIGKCSVLHHSDYIRGRCTEITEEDVFVYRCRYEEGREFWKTGGKSGSRQGSKQVPADEWYYFKKTLQLWTTQGSPFLQEALQECLNATEPPKEIVAEKTVEKEVTTEIKQEPISSESAECVKHEDDSKSTEDIQSTANDLETPSAAQSEDLINYEDHNRRVKYANGYPLFLREKYSCFKRKHPGKTINELRRMIHLKWKKMEPEEQTQYHMKAREKIQHAWNTDLGRRTGPRKIRGEQRSKYPTVTPSILKIRVPKLKPNNDKRGKHFRRGFNMLVADLHGPLKVEYPDKCKKDLMKIINEKWQSLTKEEQEVLHIRARDNMLKKQMRKYGRHLDYMRGKKKEDGEREEEEEVAAEGEEESEDNNKEEVAENEQEDEDTDETKKEGVKNKKMKKAFGYAVFVKEWYKLTSKIHPSKGRLEIYQIVHDKWAKLSREEQLVYNRKAQGGQLRPRKVAIKTGIRVTHDKNGGVTKKPKVVKAARAYSTGYNLYSKEIYPTLRKANPDKGHTDVMRIIGQHWKALDEQTQQKYMEAALMKRGLGPKSADSCSSQVQRSTSSTEVAESKVGGEAAESGKPLQRLTEPTSDTTNTNISTSMRSPFYRFYKRWSKRLSDKFKGKPKGSLKKCIMTKWKALSEEEKEPYKEPYRIRREAKRKRLMAERMRKSKIKTVRELLSEKRTDSEASGNETIDTLQANTSRLVESADVLDLSNQHSASKPDFTESGKMTPPPPERDSLTPDNDTRSSKSDSGELDTSFPQTSLEKPKTRVRTRGRGRGRGYVSNSGGRVCTRQQVAHLKRAIEASTYDQPNIDKDTNTESEKSQFSPDVNTPVQTKTLEAGKATDLTFADKDTQKWVEETNKENDETSSPYKCELRRDELRRDEYVGHVKDSIGLPSNPSTVDCEPGHMAPPVELISQGSGHPAVSTTTNAGDQISKDFLEFEMRLREMAEEDDSLPLPGSVRLQMYSEDIGETISLLRCLVGRCDFLCNKRAWMKLHLQIEHKKLIRQRRSSCGSSSRSETPMSDSTTKSVLATPDKPAVLDRHKLSLLSHFPLHMAASILKAEELNSDSPSSNGEFQIPSTEPPCRNTESHIKHDPSFTMATAPSSSSSSSVGMATAPSSQQRNKDSEAFINREDYVSTPPPALAKELPTEETKPLSIAKVASHTSSYLIKKRHLDSEDGFGPVDLTIPVKKRKFTAEAFDSPTDYSRTGRDCKHGVSGLVIEKSWTVSPNEQHLWLDSQGEYNSHHHGPQLNPLVQTRPDMSKSLNPQDMKSSCFVSRMRGHTLEPFENIVEKKNRGRPRRGTSPEGHYASDHMPSSVGGHSMGTNSSPDSGYASSSVEQYMHSNSISSLRVNSSGLSTLPSSRESAKPMLLAPSDQEKTANSSRGMLSKTSNTSSHSTANYGTFPVVTSMLQKGGVTKEQMLPAKVNYYQRLIESDLSSSLQLSKPEPNNIQSMQGPPELTPQSVHNIHHHNVAKRTHSPSNTLPNLTNLLEKQQVYKRTSNAMPGLIKVNTSVRQQQQQQHQHRQNYEDVIITAENLPKNAHLIQQRGRSGAMLGPKRNLEPFTGIRDKPEALASLGLQRSSQTNQ